MSYPSKWKGSSSPDDKSGVAHFKIEDIDYALRLDCFTSYQVACEMLEAAFDQGKIFAESAMRRHVVRALDQAKTDHAL